MIERLSRLVWLATGFLLPLAFMPGAMNPFAPVKRDLFFILGLMQTGLLALRYGGDPVRAARGLAVRPAAWPLLALGAWLCLGAWSGWSPPRNISSLLEPALGCILALALLLEPPGLGWRLLLFMSAGAAAGAAYGLAQFAGFDPLTWRTGFAGAAPPATFGNPLFLGDGVIAALPAALLMAAGMRMSERRAGWLLAVPLTAALVLAQARGAWIGAVAGLGLLLYLLGRARARALLHPFLGLGALAAALILVFSVPNPLNVRKADIAGHLTALSRPRGGDFTGRFMLWHGGALLARENPIAGAGPGQLAARYTEIQGRLLTLPAYRHLPYHSTSHAHQDLLQILAERGAVGLGLTLWLLTAVFAAGIAKSPGRGGLAALCALAAWLVDGLFNGPLHLPPSSIQFWLLIGIAGNARPAALGLAAPRRPGRFGPALAAVVLILAVRPFARDFLSEAYLRAGDYYLRNGQPALALPLSLRAFGFAVEDRRHHFCLGEIYFHLGEFAEASGEFALDTKTNPGAASSWQNLGVAELKRGRRREARAAFARAQAVNPNDPELAELIRENDENLRKQALTEDSDRGKLR